MRITYDREADAIFVYVRPIPPGGAARTVCLNEGDEIEDWVNLELDDEGRTLGVEFLSLQAFTRYLKEHGGLKLPEPYTGETPLLTP
jgi:uncharacterized protein YuzE